jgi:hypothetical protein
MKPITSISLPSDMVVERETLFVEVSILRVKSQVKNNVDDAVIMITGTIPSTPNL